MLGVLEGTGQGPPWFSLGIPSERPLVSRDTGDGVTDLRVVRVRCCFSLGYTTEYVEVGHFGPSLPLLLRSRTLKCQDYLHGLSFY